MIIHLSSRLPPFNVSAFSSFLFTSPHFSSPNSADKVEKASSGANLAIGELSRVLAFSGSGGFISQPLKRGQSEAKVSRFGRASDFATNWAIVGQKSSKLGSESSAGQCCPNGPDCPSLWQPGSGPVESRLAELDTAQQSVAEFEREERNLLYISTLGPKRREEKRTKFIVGLLSPGFLLLPRLPALVVARRAPFAR